MNQKPTKTSRRPPRADACLANVKKKQLGTVGTSFTTGTATLEHDRLTSNSPQCTRASSARPTLPCGFRERPNDDRVAHQQRGARRLGKIELAEQIAQAGIRFAHVRPRIPAPVIRRIQPLTA